MEFIKCPGCNSNLSYNSEQEVLKCDYCGNICNIKLAKNYIENQIEMHECVCQDCGAKLISSSNTLSTKCTYCGSSVLYNEKLISIFKPEKILLFKFGLEKAKTKAKKYFKNSTLAWKNDIIEAISPVYIPYWMYSCIFNVDFEGKVENGIEIQQAKVVCEGLLADGSKKLNDIISDEFDMSFNLSKLKEFKTSFIIGYYAEKYDVAFEDVYKRMIDKLKREVIRKELHFWDEGKIDIINDKSTYLLLPCYYANVNGCEILINGQNGEIVVNSKEVLDFQTKKELKSSFSTTIVAVILLLVGFIVATTSQSMGVVVAHTIMYGISFIFGYSILGRIKKYFFVVAILLLGFGLINEMLLPMAINSIIFSGIGTMLYLKEIKNKRKYIKKIIYKKIKRRDVVTDYIMKKLNKNSLRNTIKPSIYEIFHFCMKLIIILVLIAFIGLIVYLVKG